MPTPLRGKSPTRMPDMIEQLRRAVIWLVRNAQSFGGRLEGGYRLAARAPVTFTPYAADQAAPGYAIVETAPLSNRKP